MLFNPKALWAILHILAITFVSASLLSGARIGVLEYPFLLRLHTILPQGQVHLLHFASAWGLTTLLLIYGALSTLQVFPKKPAQWLKKWPDNYHRLSGLAFKILLPLLMISGWAMSLDSPLIHRYPIKQWHGVCAGFVFLIVLLHAGGYLVHQGSNAIKRITRPIKQFTLPLMMSLLILSLLATSVAFVTLKTLPHSLIVATLSANDHIHIDGLANEPAWQKAQAITINTQGGANFVNGQTPIQIKALHNDSDAYFHFSWQDPSKSLVHLPLIKTTEGWQVKQQGFSDFDERQWYEDKFAVILSNTCEMNAAGTAHLGAKPINDKPKHWTGKGYHYRQEGIVDLWQWKAVRTNSMRLMDDNYIGQPAMARTGDRRYTAGYQQDGKESGAYKMNWQWFYANKITPKRLPIHLHDITPYQKVSSKDLPWVLPWFDTQPYHKQIDNYPVGTLMPSILHVSNQFEGDRGHVRAYAVWHQGVWSLEVFRKRQTHSTKDIDIMDGICLWVAAFDHSQIAHTRHTRPIQLDIP
ncbi:MAG: ethylbenzene dehydrogenase-related protein [Cellvibrionales bacterium]|nr:ethylbenzene dehydrogenase-related protein [Cellvibrionales bacterium]